MILFYNENVLRGKKVLGGNYHKKSSISSNASSPWKQHITYKIISHELEYREREARTNQNKLDALC